MTPYGQAWDLIQKYGDSGGATGLKKLLLSLFDPDQAFGIRECTVSFDSKLQELAIKVITHFFSVGEDEELRNIGRHIIKENRRLYEIGMAGEKVKFQYANESAPEEN